MTTFSSAPAEAGIKLEPTEWLDFHVYGDFRFRNEFDLVRSTPADPIRYRMRIRARLGTKAVFFDQVEVGLRIRTGNASDANSPHQTFSDGFGKFAFGLDRAYAKWTPKPLGGSYVLVGKFSNPYEKRAVFGEVVWDDDVSPTGVILSGKVPVQTVFDAFRLAGGVYLFAENKNGPEGVMPSAQASFHFQFGDAGGLMVAQGMYAIVDPQPGGAQAFVLENQGNALVDSDGDGVADAFASDFLVLNTLVSLELKGPGFGVQVGGEFIANAQTADDNLGFGVGVKVPINIGHDGCNIAPWFDFHQVGQEAVFSPLAQDDHQWGASGYRGISAGVNWKYAPFGDARVYVHAEQGLDDDPSDPWATRLRLDLNFSF